MLAGAAPILALKARYFEDERLRRRILAPPSPWRGDGGPGRWTQLEASDHQDAPAQPSPLEQRHGRESQVSIGERFDAVRNEFGFDEADEPIERRRQDNDRVAELARQAAMDPDDGVEL